MKKISFWGMLALLFLLIRLFPAQGFAEETQPQPATPQVQATAPESKNTEIMPPASTQTLPELVAQEKETNTNLRPKVIITPSGNDYQIKVSYDHPMDIAKQNYIEYIRLETLDGEFLGLMTSTDQLTKATAEFVINPKLVKFNSIRLVAKSSSVGLIKSIHKLELTPQEEIDAANPEAVNGLNQGSATAKEMAKKETGSAKKKFFGIF